MGLEDLLLDDKSIRTYSIEDSLAWFLCLEQLLLQLFDSFTLVLDIFYSLAWRITFLTTSAISPSCVGGIRHSYFSAIEHASLQVEHIIIFNTHTHTQRIGLMDKVAVHY